MVPDAQKGWLPDLRLKLQPAQVFGDGQLQYLYSLIFSSLTEATSGDYGPSTPRILHN